MKLIRPSIFFQPGPTRTVYESSLYLAVIFDSPKQTTSIISALVPEVYLSTPPPHRLCLPTILLSSLHHLLVAYPSQVPFNQFLQSIPETLLPRASPIYAWITSLAASIRTRNSGCTCISMMCVRVLVDMCLGLPVATCLGPLLIPSPRPLRIRTIQNLSTSLPPPPRNHISWRRL